MSIDDSKPDMGALSGIPDMGAWHFVGPDGLEAGALANIPTVTGALEDRPALTGKLGDYVTVDGELGIRL